MDGKAELKLKRDEALAEAILHRKEFDRLVAEANEYQKQIDKLLSEANLLKWG